MNVFQTLLDWKVNDFDENAYNCLTDYRQKQKRKQESALLERLNSKKVSSKTLPAQPLKLSLNLTQVEEDNEESESGVQKLSIGGFK